VVLRSLRLSDAPSLFQHAREPGIRRHLEWSLPREVEETEEFITRALREAAVEPPRHRHFAIALDESGEAIGVTSLHEIDLIHRRATIGSWIGRPHWGKGLMREAKALILQFAFDELQLERVQAWVVIDNQRSLSNLESCGFRREGVARCHARVGDRSVNQVLLAILRGEQTALVEEVLGGRGRDST
jgi:ribosomal-protein-alanine N-acetyltransferase